jgi:CubicO group peptidase (beta-lactamase class C family)
MLRGGTWDGHEIVAPGWVARSTETRDRTGGGKGYGYQWWTLEGGISAAQGHYEQKVYVVAEADVVVVFTSESTSLAMRPTRGSPIRI